MDIHDHLIGNVAVVQLAGRLTVNDRPGMLKEAVAAALQRGASHVLLDMHDVHYIDSTRLGELISAHVTVSRQGGRLKLARTPHRVSELLTMAGLGDIFERFESVEDGTKSFES